MFANVAAPRHTEFWEDFVMRSVSPFFMTAAVVCCVVGCGGKQGQQAPATLTPTTSMGEVNAPHGGTVPGGGAFKAEINPTNNGTVTGIATMSAGEGGNTTVVNMTLGGPRGTYTWHIHEGSCGNVGVVMGDKSNYPPVPVGDSGQITFRTNLNFYPPAGGNYAVVVRQGSDPTQEGNIVACGNLHNVTGP
jgi:hypothetical protein